MREAVLMQMTDIPVPGTPAAVLAHEVSRRFSTEALLNHCRRSYLWAAAYAGLNDIGFDAELLYVASMLHDLGLSAEFDSHTVPFEAAGGHVAWVFAAGAGWPVARRERVSEIVVRHMWDDVDVAADPESHLLALATSLDISGAVPSAWPLDLREEIVAAIPRLTLRTEFVDCFRDQATRKPGSAAAVSFHSGIADRMASNPLESPPASAARPGPPVTGR
jgi:HD superfamily phosphodiesterase